MFTIGDQLYFYATRWEVDTAAYAGDHYIDSGMLLRWEPQSLNPDKYMNIVTYIGLGDDASTGDSIMLFTLAPSMLTANCTSISPNPFEVSLLVHNKHFVDGLSGIQACFNSIPEGITPTYGEGHWPDTCHPIPNLDLDETGSTAWLFALDSGFVFPEEPVQFVFIVVSSDLEDTIWDTVYVDIPSPTGIPPTVYPVNSKRFTSYEFDSVLYIPFLPEDDEGIDYSSMRGSSGPITISYFSEWWELEGDTILLSSPLWYSTHGDTILSSITDLKDINGCRADILPVTDTLIIDREAPIVTGSWPTYGRHVDSIPEVTFFVEDLPSGIDPTSIIIYADDEPYTYPAPELSYTDTSITFTSSIVYNTEGYPFEITLLYVCDNVNYGPPNCITEEYTLATWVDPGAVSESPSLPLIPGISSIRPNPANASFEIEFTSTSGGLHSMTLYTTNGQRLMHKDLLIEAPGKIHQIVDLSVIDSGIYLVKIYGPGIEDQGRLCVVK